MMKSESNEISDVEEKTDADVEMGVEIGDKKQEPVEQPQSRQVSHKTIAIVIIGLLIVFIAVLVPSVLTAQKNKNPNDSISDPPKNPPEDVPDETPGNNGQGSSSDSMTGRTTFNQLFFQKKKLSVSLPEFNNDILEGYAHCDLLVDDLEQALADLANIRIQLDMNHFEPSPFMTEEHVLEVDFDDSAPEESMTVMKGSSDSSMAENSFETNNQHEDVDEADTTKSDGTFIYTVYGSDIVVLDTIGTEKFRLTLFEQEEPDWWGRPPDIVIEEVDEGESASSSGSTTPIEEEPPPVMTESVQSKPAIDETETVTNTATTSTAASSAATASTGNRRKTSKMIVGPSKIINSLLLHDNKLVAFVSDMNFFYHSVSPDTTDIIIMDIDLTNGTLSISDQTSVNGIYQGARLIDSNVHLVTTTYVQNWEFSDHLSRWRHEYFGLNDTEYAEMAFENAKMLIPKYARKLAIELLSEEAPSESNDGNLVLPSDTCQYIAKISSYQNGKVDDDSNNVDWTGLQGTLNGFVRVTSFDVTSDGMLGDSASTSAAFVPTAYADVYATQDMLFLGGRGWAARTDETSGGSQDVTYITAFEFQGASALPKATGVVTGYTINQFSFDFFDNYLRVATTNSAQWFWDPETRTGSIISESTNQIIVTQIQDNQINVVGQLENLGETEMIYAVRFMGDRAFMVTFRQTDPFYTIDLSTPTAPVLRGELKIPGFSNYLHPMDDNTILAVGQDADESTGRTLGLQIAIFDVSDLDAPTQSAKYVVKGWSQSDAQHDFKAFRYLPLSQKLILPISKYSHFRDEEEDDSFDGFHVYDIDPDASDVNERIVLDFVVSHFEGVGGHVRCYGNGYLQPRSLVFEGKMMTLKGHSVLGHDLESGERLYDLELDEGLDENDKCYGWFF